MVQRTHVYQLQKTRTVCATAAHFGSYLLHEWHSAVTFAYLSAMPYRLSSLPDVHVHLLRLQWLLSNMN
jgi:hypothetical protein